MGQPRPARNQSAWWRSAVIYQVYVRSFADGDGDGTGDLAGVRARLPYLAELGVDALWFNPGTAHPWPTAATTWPTTAPSTRRSGRSPRRRSSSPKRASWASAPSSTSCPTTSPTSTPGSGRPSPAARSGSCSTSAPGAGSTARSRPTTGPHSSPAPPNRSGPGCPTATGTSISSPRTARPQLGTPGGPPGTRGDPAFLVRTRRRGCPHRLGRPAGQGPGAARLRRGPRPEPVRRP